MVPSLASTDSSKSTVGVDGTRLFVGYRPRSFFLVLKVAVRHQDSQSTVCIALAENSLRKTCGRTKTTFIGLALRIVTLTRKK